MLVLRQIKINCPSDGEYLWRAFTMTYVIGSQPRYEQREEEPVCAKCHPNRYLIMMRAAQRIEPLTSEIHVNEPISDAHGEKIQRVTGRHPVKESDERIGAD